MILDRQNIKQKAFEMPEFFCMYVWEFLARSSCASQSPGQGDHSEG